MAAPPPLIGSLFKLPTDVSIQIHLFIRSWLLSQCIHINNLNTLSAANESTEGLLAGLDLPSAQNKSWNISFMRVRIKFKVRLDIFYGFGIKFT